MLKFLLEYCDTEQRGPIRVLLFNRGYFTGYFYLIGAILQGTFLRARGFGGGREGRSPPRHGQFCRCDCSVLVVAGVSLVLSVQNFRKLIMQVEGGGPLSLSV